jgi:two-component system LytT family response regulator
MIASMNGAMNVLIVDDEPLAREGLALLLRDETGIGSVSEARNGAEAVEKIGAARPDLVLLDVQMPEMDGFDVLRAVGAERMPPVIFVTAFDRYAIQAFEVNAVDYLLKPVARERFSQALARVRERIASGPDNQHVLALLQQLAAPKNHLARVALRSAGKISFVNVEDILYVQAAENYVQLHLETSRHLLHVPIATFEQSLDPEKFLRIHRSLIVNVRHIAQLETGPHGEYVVVLHGGARLQSSRSYHEKIKRWAANPF